MRMLSTTVALLVVLAGATSSLAQTLDDSSPSPLPARAIPLSHPLRAPQLLAVDGETRHVELTRWIHDFSQWKEWAAQYGNQTEPGWFSSSRKRRPRPDPPGWLFDRCGNVDDDAEVMVEGCALLAEWGTDYATAVRTNARAAASAQKEDEDKTTFWEHVHVEALWPAMQSGAMIYGVIGMHVTTTVHGRFQVFVAPGAMVLNVPTRDGGRAWKMAANWGIAYSLFGFNFPGGRPAQLHLDFAKAWLLDAGTQVETKSTDFIGFSVTFKKKR